MCKKIFENFSLSVAYIILLFLLFLYFLIKKFIKNFIVNL